MKRILSVAILFCASLHVQAAKDIPFAGIVVHLPDSAESAGIVSQGDSYTRSFSDFDLHARLQTTGSATEKDYLALAARSVRNWDADEIEQVTASLEEINTFLDKEHIKLALPARVNIIRTTCAEEFGAEGYTRGASIFLNVDNKKTLEVHTVAHELFHILSRYNKATRDKLYAIFGFKPCNAIDVKAALAGRNVTNPDCPVLEHYITVPKDGGQDMVIILHSKKDYTGGSNVFEQYMSIDMLELTGDKIKTAKMEHGKPVIKSFEEVPVLFKQVGANTSYLLHPEEICAEHFAMMIDGSKVRQPEYIEQLEQVLQQ